MQTYSARNRAVRRFAAWYRFANTLAVLILLVPVNPAVAGDDRQLVTLPPMMRDHMLRNMRDHLAAMADIQQALSKGDFSGAADIAEKRLGMSSLDAHGASHMAPFMPQAMQEIGTAMHRAASRFAVAAQESAVDADAKRAIGALSAVTRQCIACHASFRAQ